MPSRLRSRVALPTLFIVGMGALFAIIGAGVFYFTSLRFDAWTEVPGVVQTFKVDSAVDENGVSRAVYCPIVAYDSLAGEHYEITLDECFTATSLLAGDRVRLAYDLPHPDRPHLRDGPSETAGKVISLIAAGVGGLIMVIGVVFGLKNPVAPRQGRPSSKKRSKQ